MGGEEEYENTPLPQYSWFFITLKQAKSVVDRKSSINFPTSQYEIIAQLMFRGIQMERNDCSSCESSQQNGDDHGTLLKAEHSPQRWSSSSQFTSLL